MSQQVANDVTGVLTANERFYEALSGRDLEAMEAVWSTGGDARCIHPGWDVVAGWQAVRESWRAIFASSPGLRVDPDEVEVSFHGELAWLQCLEKITNAAEEDDEPSFARATNIFVRGEGGWRMLLHHASQVPVPPDAEPKAVH